MDDLISRQEAIDALIRAEALTRAFGYRNVIETIRNLPSAKKERCGQWFTEEKDSIYGKKYILTCSECDDTYAASEDALPYEKYCRTCGSRNRITFK